ncbi:MAG: hypothetical protein ABGZ17_09000 [Planctomycetaceae bacterium]
MGLLIGMDEAGYGPNLGPLVVTLTVWQVPGDPRQVDLWSAFAPVIDQTGQQRASHLHVADSKDVYSPARGLLQLETAVQAGLHLADMQADGFFDLHRQLCHPTANDLSAPWYSHGDLALPRVADAQRVAGFRDAWSNCCAAHDVTLTCIASDVVQPNRFNTLTRQADSKGVALTRISLNLLRRVWQPDSDERVLIIADKHGGRNRYDAYLDEVIDGQMIFRVQESRSRSQYRIGNTEIWFQTQAEQHLPVALASMVAKYMRELSMEFFNTFWCQRVPDLRPTRGYPVDARRFRAEIAEMQGQLNIRDDDLWRAR